MRFIESRGEIIKHFTRTFHLFSNLLYLKNGWTLRNIKYCFITSSISVFEFSASKYYILRSKDWGTLLVTWQKYGKAKLQWNNVTLLLLHFYYLWSQNTNSFTIYTAKNIKNFLSYSSTIPILIFSTKLNSLTYCNKKDKDFDTNFGFLTY